MFKHILIIQSEILFFIIFVTMLPHHLISDVKSEQNHKSLIVKRHFQRLKKKLYIDKA